MGQVTTTAGSPNVQFEVPASQSNIYLSSNEFDMQTLSTSSTGQQQETVQSMVLVVRRNGSAVGQGQNLQSSYSNFYVNGLSQSNVANYGQVTFSNVYQGIDLSYDGSSGSLEYSFTVNRSPIRVRSP